MGQSEIATDYAAWLGISSVPKLLLHAQPGAILRKDMVAWCEANVKNLTAVDIGPGLHFVQEDRPHEIGEANPELVRRTDV